MSNEITAPITIQQTVITAPITLGLTGKSAYQSYLDTTTDDPVLTEEEWSAPNSGAWEDITGKPSTFAPSAHASSHATAGSDPIALADIGAASATSLGLLAIDVGNQIAKDLAANNYGTVVTLTGSRTLLSGDIGNTIDLAGFDLTMATGFVTAGDSVAIKGSGNVVIGGTPAPLDGSATLVLRYYATGWEAFSVSAAGVTSYNDLTDLPTLGSAAALDADTAATVNTVARRDSSGRLLATAFLSQNAEQSIYISQNGIEFLYRDPQTEEEIGLMTIAAGGSQLGTSGVFFPENKNGTLAITSDIPAFGTTAGTAAEGNHTHTPESIGAATAAQGAKADTALQPGDAVVTAGVATDFYLDTTSSLADNFALTTSPPSYTETVNTKLVTSATSPVFHERFVSGPLNRSSIPAGTWSFKIYGSVDSIAAGSISKILFRINKRVAWSGVTGTWSGTGSVRTFTASTGTPFSSITGNANRLLAPLIETPNQTGWISAVGGGGATLTVNITDTGYVNEANVNVNAIYFWLFNSETAALAVSPALYTVDVVASEFTGLNPSDRLVAAFFCNTSTSANRNVSLYYGGVTRFTHFESPIGTQVAAADVVGYGALASKTTPIDADSTVIVDSADADKPKRLTFANLKTWLGSWLDSVVTTIAGAKTASGAWSFTSTTRPTSSGTGTPAATSLITTTDGDARYGYLQTSALAADHAGVSSSTSLVDTGISLTLAAGTYEIAGLLYCTANASGGARGQLTLDSATGVSCALAGWYGDGGNGAIRNYAAQGAVSSLFLGTTTTAAGVFNASGRLVLTQTRTIKFQYAQAASNAAATVAKTESYLSARKIA